MSNSSDSYSETTIRSDSLSTDVFVFLVERGRKEKKKEISVAPKDVHRPSISVLFSPPPPSPLPFMADQ